MDRKIVVKANGSNVLTWLHDWCYEKLVKDPYKRFNPRSLLEDFLADKRILSMIRQEIKQKLPENRSAALGDIDDDALRKQIAENVTLVGEFSKLRVGEKSLKLYVEAQYSLDFSSGSPRIFQENAQVFLLKVHRVGKHRAQIQAECDIPEVEWILDNMWQDARVTFDVAENTAVAHSSSSSKSDKDNQFSETNLKPRYQEILENIDFKDTTGWDMTLIEMWNKSFSRGEIAARVHVQPGRVTTRVYELRRLFGVYGKDVLPYRDERKKRRK